ncbi:hypothetical protein BH23ACT10_BH23ACT10_34690 [soil metagenome]
MGTATTGHRVKLALDHHYSPTIAHQLRRLGHDVVAAQDRTWQREDDDTLLHLCMTEDRALLTNNVGDFSLIARRWTGEGRPHAGLIFTSDRSMPRNRDTIGRYVAALDDLLRSHPGTTDLRDQVHWL